MTELQTAPTATGTPGAMIELHGVGKRPEMLDHVDRLYQERNARLAKSLPACRLRPDVVT